MQVKYLHKSSPTHWDPVHLTYPVRKFPDTGISSETIARGHRSEPEVLKPIKTGCYEVKRYGVDHSVRNDLLRSQTAVDYSYKVPETKIFNKHTSGTGNKYVYPPQKNLSDRVPKSRVRAYGVSEARDKYRSPVLDSKLVTDKDQYKTHHSFEPCEPIPKDIEPLFYDYDGFEKYLDPYVTTSRLHHRSFAAEQTDRTNDIVTYYTCSNTPWVRSRKPHTAEWPLPKSKAKSVYDREKFKNEFREIRTHNKLHTFRTEVSDNFTPKPGQLESKVYSNEEQVRAFHAKTMASLKTGILEEDLVLKRMYKTENAVVGSRKPLCAVFDPYVDRNKRLASMTSIHIINL